MPPSSKKVETRYRCTACSSTIKTSFEAFLHPLLKVLICRKCHTDYGTGDFSTFNDPEIGPGVDENGDDNYCRWCVDGGDLFACGGGDPEDPDRCHYAFCTDCIKRNCPGEEVLCQENYPPNLEFKWLCFACDPDKLKKHRHEAQEIILALSGRDLKRPNNNISTPKDSTCIASNGSNGPRTPVIDIDKNREVDSATRQRPRNKDREQDSKVDDEQEKQHSNERERELEQKQKEKRDKEQQLARERELADKEKEQHAIREKEQQAASKQKEKSNEVRRDKDRERDSGSGPASDEGQATKKRKIDNSSSSSSDNASKEPEACSMPPVAPPKPPESALRRLSKKVPPPDAPKGPSNIHPSSSTGNSSSSTSTKTVSQIQASLPSSIKVKLPQTQHNLDSAKTNNPMKARAPLSKQLKANNEQIKPSCKVPLSEIELKKRLENMRSVKQNCIKEMEIKFRNVFEMFESNQLGPNKAILKFEINELEKPVQEFNSMIRDLQSLFHSQI